MQTLEKTITKNKLMDHLFINFPLWFPIVYIFLIFNFPGQGKILFLASLFLFAETHFASTWLFFFDSENWNWLRRNFYEVFCIPLYTVLLMIFVWNLWPTTIIIIHYLASGWHVTKQSAGILNIYGIKSKTYKLSVYFISFSCLAIGLNKPGILLEYIDIVGLNLLLLTSAFLYILLVFFSANRLLNSKIEQLMPIITGILIYLPILFFKDLATATAVGVGMHWCQYLAIVWSKHFRKNAFSKTTKGINFSKKSFLYFTFILLYAFTMTSFAMIGLRNISNLKIEYNFFYMIPLLFQLYHFYIDGFIWKFSDPHIKKSVLPFLFSN